MALQFTMRPEHYLCLTLTPAAQAMLLLAAIPRTKGDPLSVPIAILALAIPLVCYVWGLHSVPMLAKINSRFLRLLLLALVAGGITLAGFAYGLLIITAHTTAAPP